MGETDKTTAAKYGNPFALEPERTEMPSDEELATTAQAGNKDALETLVRRHQPWVFNLAVRMLWSRDLAEDATQEILVKAITKLSTFRGLSRFRTWFYRLAVNHLLNMRTTQLEERRMTLTNMGLLLDSTPDLDLPDPNSVPVDLALIIEETSATCMTAMLMCLDRRQRVAFILGEIFGVSSELGGEVMEISPDNFRQILSRARHDLYQFMQEKCGLVNQANPCRCTKKTRGFMDAGYVDANRRQFTADRLARISEVTSNRLAELQDLDRQHAELFREHGFLESPDLAAKLRELVATSNFEV
jgi:RNA polymerase sigma factor (sigma-70 family)